MKSRKCDAQPPTYSSPLLGMHSINEHGIVMAKLAQSSGKLPALLTLLRHDASIIKELDLSYKDLLLWLIEEISWNHTAASHLTDIEFYLWAVIVDETSIDYYCDLNIYISQTEINDLKLLFSLTQAWPSGNLNTHWFSKQEWANLYKKWLTKEQNRQAREKRYEAFYGLFAKILPFFMILLFFVLIGLKTFLYLQSSRMGLFDYLSTFTIAALGIFYILKQWVQS